MNVKDGGGPRRDMSNTPNMLCVNHSTHTQKLDGQADLTSLFFEFAFYEENKSDALLF